MFKVYIGSEKLHLPKETAMSQPGVVFNQKLNISVKYACKLHHFETLTDEDHKNLKRNYTEFVTEPIEHTGLAVCLRWANDIFQLAQISARVTAVQEPLAQVPPTARF